MAETPSGDNVPATHGAPQAQAPRPPPAPEPAPGPWVVGVGASAGGLEALQRLFGELRRPTRAAFVVIQHLAPDHRSMMVELLSRHCELPVTTAEPAAPLEADHVYLMPPGVTMTLAANQFTFEPRPASGISLPIDLFLGSLSQVAPERSIGVILSGSGSDGSIGATHLRAAGGYVLVQTPETAKFDSMPRSTLAATAVDATLTPEEIAHKVMQLATGQATRLGAGEIIAAESARPSLQRLFDRLHQASGIDFSQYKMATVMRRIERRMAASGCTSLSHYADVVADSVSECEALRRELLIPVTSFLRDPQALDTLRPLLRRLVEQQPEGKPLRVWSAGCATGEEPYTLAMLLAEACHLAQRWPGYKIFASDVDQTVLDLASAGTYPAAAIDHLPAPMREQFFTQHDDQVTVKPELRQSVLFTRHNLLDDAPFTRIDLVSCRNTLIYLQAQAQDRVMRRLQYALNPEGLLFLGSSESLGGLQPDFITLDPTFKIYRLLRPALTSSVLRDGFGRHAVVPPRPARPGAATMAVPPLVERSAQQLMSDYVPLSLLVNEQRQLLHAWGPTRRWLRLPEGQPGLDAIRLMPPAIGLLAVHALRVVLLERRRYRSEPVRVQLDDQDRLVRMVGQPIEVDGEPTPCVLLSLEELPTAGDGPAGPAARDLDPASLDRIATLEAELNQLRASHQASVEELEASNEELQATNEELMSSNEELQSTNEELQSVNEELHTVNAEYNTKLEALSNLNADLEGMATSTGIATLFLDGKLSLVRFTPEATLLFRLRPSDIGRPLEDFSSRVDYPDLLEDLRIALDTGTLIEREVRGPHGSWHLVRVLGYSTPGSHQARAVVSLIDVSRVRDARRLQGLIDSLPEHVAVLDLQGTIRLVNRSWERFAAENSRGAPALTGVGANYFAVLANATDPEALNTLRGLQDVMGGRRAEFSLTYPCHGPSEERWFVMHARRLGAPEEGAVITHFNISAWLQPRDHGHPALPAQVLDAARAVTAAALPASATALLTGAP